MAEYRDEKETLRRRVQELEAALAERGADERDASTERRALREERDAARARVEALEKERGALRDERDRLARRLAKTSGTKGGDGPRRRLVPGLATGGAAALASGIVLVALGAPAWASTSAMALFVAAAACLVLVLTPPRRRAKIAEEPERPARSKRAKRARVELETKRKDASYEATRRRARPAGRRGRKR